MFIVIDSQKNTIILDAAQANELAKIINKHGIIGEVKQHKNRKELDAEISAFLKGELK